MECNRDEAARAKEIAVRKFTAKDIAGAKKFALKAQSLYPELEGLAQMLATLDVHLSAENKISGEADWYGILGVTPSADDETVKKQYRKLALMLHPDKNKSVGADGAFKLISEAWSLLSDKSKRIVYDQKRFPKAYHQNVSYAGGGSHVPPGTNGFNFSNSMHMKVGTQKSATRTGLSTTPAPSHPVPRPSKNNTFWTACNKCKMQYEYLRIYLNHNLLCPNCHEPFLAKEIADGPTNGSKSSTPWSFAQNNQNSNHHTAKKNVGTSGFNQKNFQWAPFSTSGVGNASASASTTAHSASVQQAYDKVKRECEEVQAAARKKEAPRKRNRTSKKAAVNLSAGFPDSGPTPSLRGESPFKKRNVDDGVRVNNHGVSASYHATGNRGTGIGVGPEKDRASAFAFTFKPYSARELSHLELRNMLVDKARKEILEKLSEWSVEAASKAKQKEREMEKETGERRESKETVAVNGNQSDQKIESAVIKNESNDKKSSLDTFDDVDSETEASEPVTISVPDPDFHDFDQDRSERSFAENQVWAAYDDDDGMPRYYAIIHKVISLSPFKLRISWLNSKSNSELGPMNWVGSGFSKICGDFRVGKYEVNDSLNSFSHSVCWTKGVRGAIQIYPRKGDIWALYQNWSPEWNELMSDEVIHKYDMVEVLDDYTDEQGVSITPLIKVAGFKTVFHRHMDPKEVKRIPREEMFRFSHQVPSYLLTGSEAQNAPKGCRELDPAATPLELLQVITDVKEEETVATVGKQAVADVKKTDKVVNSAEHVYERREKKKVGNLTRPGVKENDTMGKADKQNNQHHKCVNVLEMLEKPISH